MEPNEEQARAMLAYLLRDRCENYGYDYKAFRRISDQRYRARKAARGWHPSLLKWQEAPLAHRIDWDTMGYTVGQSSNEEITNLLRQLVNPNAGWVS